MKTKSLLLIAGLSVAGFAAWRWHGQGAEPAAEPSDARLVRDRLWVDHMPRNDRDTFRVFALLSSEGVGVFQATSQWRGQYELFVFEMGGDEIRAVFPQTGDHEKMQAKASKCREQGFDYCLELSGASHGAKRYYSREGWDLRGLAQVDSLGRAISKE